MSAHPSMSDEEYLAKVQSIADQACDVLVNNDIGVITGVMAALVLRVAGTFEEQHHGSGHYFLADMAKTLLQVKLLLAEEFLAGDLPPRPTPVPDDAN